LWCDQRHLGQSSFFSRRYPWFGAAVKAGTDLSCGEQYELLAKAVKAHLIDEQVVDQAVKRLFTARFRLGMFDPPDAVPYSKIPFSDLNSPQHRQLALQSARETMVLLKNQNKILPLNQNIKTIAVVGPEADFLPSLLGNYNGTPVNPVTPLAGIERRFASHAKILYAQGSKLTEEQPVPVPASVLQPSQLSQTALGGLTGEYFDNADLKGNAVVTRTDQSIDFDWAGIDPIPGLTNGKFSVRWTGTFTPPSSGEYRLGIVVPGCYPCAEADQFKLYVDDKLVAQRTTNSHLLVPVMFEDNHAHSIRIEYAHLRGDADKNVAFGFDASGITFFWDPPADALLKQAAAVAKQADVILAFVGISPNLESEETPALNIAGFRGGDRTNIDLPVSEEHLLKTLATTGKPIVVVLENGSALAVNWAQEHASAILDAWYPGEEGGTAIAETLAGDNNPAGRLPITFYKNDSQLPPFSDYSMSNRTYRYFTGDPLYPFGFGLSYSTFSYSDLRLSAASIQAGSNLDVDVNVKNTSERDGDDVVELYLTFPKSSYSPIRALRGFTRLTIPAGETKPVHFTLSPRDLSEVDESGKHVIVSGHYDVSVGEGQPGTGVATLQGQFAIDTSKTLPR
jgi:beta-glucosidase